MELFQRGGVWWYDFQLPDQPRVRKSTGEKIRSRASVKASEALQKAMDTGSVDILLRKVPVLEVFAPDFLQWVEEYQDFGESSKKGYKNGWRLLKDTPLAKKKMDQITDDDCGRLVFPGGPANANCALRTLRRMLRKAKEMKRLFGDIPVIKEREEFPRSVEMSEDDALRIDANWELPEAPNSRLRPKMVERIRRMSEDSREAFRIIRSCGMRPKECFSMRWEYIKWREMYYCNPKGKSKAARRHVPLNFPPFNVMEILVARHERQGLPVEGWVFPSKTSECGHLTTIEGTFNQARDRAGLPSQMVLYTARHGACTAAAEVTTLKDTMQLFGHRNMETAAIYQHPKNKQVGERLWERMKTQSDEKFLAKVGVSGK